MELFRITCVTCQAKLSVRDRSAIGQIFPCPRCGSMVQVTAPEAAPAALETPSAAASASLPPSGASEAFAEDSVIADADASLPTDSQPPGQSLGSASGLLRGKVLIWSLAATTVCGAIVAGLVLSQGSAPTGIEGASANSAPLESETPLHAPADAKQPSSEPFAAVPPSAESSPPITTPNTNAGALDEPNADSLPALADSMMPPHPGDSSEQTVEAKPTAAAESESTGLLAKTSAPTPAPAKKQPSPPPFDPLDIDPEGFDLASLRTPRPRPAAEPQAEKPSPPPIDLPSDDALPETAEPDVPVEIRTQIVRRGPDGPSLADLPMAEEQLAQKFPAIEIDRMPLFEFLNLVSQWGNVPISLGPEQLQMAAISARMPVSVRREQASLGEVLRDALKPLRLDYRAAGPCVVLFRPDAEKRRRIDYPIADLVSAATSAEQLAKWTRQLVAPETWHSSGGDGTLQVDGDVLRVEQSQRVQYQVLCFLERLRLARKLKPRSSYPVERLSLLSASGRLAEKLDTRTTFTFSHYTPLCEIFTFWQQQLGVAVLVDWPAALVEQAGPQTQIACSVINKPWPAALDAVLEPIGLGWRAVDNETIEITTARVVHEQPWLKFHALDRHGKQGSTEMLARLRQLLDDRRAIASNRSPAALLFDPASNMLLAYEPAANGRRLEKWLSRPSTARSK